MKRTVIMLALCAVAGISAQTQKYTHFVTPDGSSTTTCTAAQPCNLWRAVQLIGSASLPPGSVVRLEPGTYSHGALTMKGNGKATAPIKFIADGGEATLAGTRVKPDPAAWSLVPGKRYTYQLDWDEASPSWPVYTAAQRPPVATWRPIRVDDRLPPFTYSLGRPFSLDFPVRYTIRDSLAQVEAQHCTVWNDTAANKVYVHMCHDGEPTDADNLYLAPYGWGSVIIDGDYLWLENISFEQVSSTALKVNPSAVGTVLKNIHARASQVWLQGVNTLAEDIEVSHVIEQGAVDGGQCYDANPDFGVGECWNAYADGRALLIGRERQTSSYGQTVRRAWVHRSWNGGRIDGHNTIEDSTFWGFPNHTMEASGTGVTIRNSMFLSGQDSLFMKTNPFDDLTVEGNTFVNGVYVTASNDGNGGLRPQIGWRFRHNLTSILTMDRHAYETVESDCNAFISSGKLMRIIPTNGVPGADYTTLEQVRVATPLDAGSVARPASWWTTSSSLAKYAGQSDAVFEVSEPLMACGQRAGS